MSNINLNFLAYLLLLQVVTAISMVLDIPFVRQVLGFLFLTIIPGFLILRIFRIDKLDGAETVLLSIGLSISFLYIVGVLINSLGSLNLVSKPLSTWPVTIVLNVILCGLSVAASYSRNRGSTTLNIRGLRFWQLLSFFALPILSVMGVLSIRYFNNNIPLLFIIIAISGVVVSCVLSSKISSRLSPYYPLILFSIVLSLLLSQTLTSNYLYGDDIHGEFETFRLTKTASYWDSQKNSYVQQASDNSMLGITVLPTLLSNLLNIDGGWVFKIVFPIFFSLVSIGLYQLYRRHWSERTSFISVIFFIANYSYFVVILTNAKQMIAELFYVVLFLILLSNDADYNNSRSKSAIFMIAIFGLVVSHYSTSYIFLFVALFAWLGGKFFLKRATTRVKGSLIAFSFCLTFLWYNFMVNPFGGAGHGPFGKLVGVFQTTLNSFAAEFFSVGSRGGEVQVALGLIASPSAMHYVGMVLYDFTILLIMIGFFSLILKWKKGKFDAVVFSLVSVNMLFLISIVIVPFFAAHLELGRLYHILLMFLSPLFVLGVEAFFAATSYLKMRWRPPNLRDGQKKTSYCLLFTLTILIAFFLFQTGVVYEITNDPVPSSIALSGYRMYYNHGFIRESDVFSAAWISTYGETENMWTLADTVSIPHVLRSYSTLNQVMMLLIANDTGMYYYPGIYFFLYPQNRYFANSNTTYIYFSQFNVVEGKIAWWAQKNIYFNYSEIPILNSTQGFVNKVYSNGASEILYRVP